MQVIRTTLLGFIGVVAVSLAACGGTGITPGRTAPSTPNPNATGTAVVRFIAGAPDYASFDVKLDGVLLISTLPYSAITPYYLVSGGVTHTIEFDATGTTNPIVPAITTPVLAGVNKTVSFVLAGSQSKNNVQMQAFAEPTYTNTTLQGVVNFHNSAPSLASSLDWGTFTPGATDYTVSQTVKYTASATPVPQPTPSLVPAPAATGKGIGFYIVPTGQTASATIAPAFTILPSAIDTANANNYFPYATGGDYHLSIFVIDTAKTPFVQLVARFD